MHNDFDSIIAAKVLNTYIEIKYLIIILKKLLLAILHRISLLCKIFFQKKINYYPKTELKKNAYFKR